MTGRSIALFLAAAVCEIGGAYLVWIGIKEHRGVLFVVLGAAALTLYGVVAAFQPSSEFGRVLAAYGGVFIVGSLIWGVLFDGFQPDRSDMLGALVCLAGVGIIMYAR
jgi:small multidrug resistance family-3 protein